MPDNEEKKAPFRSDAHVLQSYNEARSLIDRLQTFAKDLSQSGTSPTIFSALVWVQMVIVILNEIARLILDICQDCD